MARWIPTSRLDELEEGGMQTIECNGVRILLVRMQGRVFATESVCTHEDADLSGGFLTEDGIMCPLHMSVFDPHTGRPGNPPATEPLRTFNVKIAEETIYVEV